MNRLDGLIKEKCPNGVEYVSLRDVTIALPKGTLKTSELITDGEYPVMNSGRSYYGRYNNYNNEDAITIAARGEYAGFVNYNSGKFWAGGLCYPYKSKDESKYSTKFIFYALKNKQEYVRGTLVAKGGIPALNKQDIDKFRIPMPPLEVQNEIVQILDNFAELTAELTAELSNRKKQYEYYRDSLLLSNSDVPRIKLRSVVKKSCSGATPKKDIKEYYDGGDIPWLRTQDVKFNEISEVNSYITDVAVKETAAKWIPANCVIVAISGASAGRCAINKIPTTTNQHCLNLEIDETKALYKYVYYCVLSQYDELISRKQGARGDLNSSLILGIEIPLPSLEDQGRIVKMLDRFNDLCGNISDGLPAEIEAREKQYAYYRDKLLSFKELVPNA